ncbi:farnesyl-diphosphate synthase [Streptomyces termitum]|uniref:Farnesyl-diphosphate synthase n=3 Tax=Streptomyces termitum TaxID=67368 RepID=A0A918W848_9ACTN|nr:farnesyl-diphosphate synthase [Streptomyces termitum]
MSFTMGNTQEETDFPVPMEEFRQKVNEKLRSSVDSVEPPRLREAMAYSLLADGKRIRPTLCLLAYQIFDTDISVALPTACGLEMLHTASLIHDDLPAMDDDDFRRGSPSNHRVFGEGMALLAGDALLAYALEFILRNSGSLRPERLLSVMAKLIEVVGPSGLSGGQAIDIHSQGRDDVDPLTVEEMHLKKTGALIEASVVTGAILGGATDAETERLATYARNLGLAYQIVDDILDETSSFEEFGKEVGQDRAAGKWTYPRLVGVEQARERVRGLIAQAVTELDGFGERAAMLRWAAHVVDGRAAA